MTVATARLRSPSAFRLPERLPDLPPTRYWLLLTTAGSRSLAYTSKTFSEISSREVRIDISTFWASDSCN